MSQINQPLRPTYPAQAQNSQSNSQSSKAQQAEKNAEFKELGKAGSKLGEDSSNSSAIQHAIEEIRDHDDSVTQLPSGKAPAHIDLGELLKHPNEAKDALKLADDMTATSRKDPAKLAEQVMKFDKMVDHMDRDELMDVAHGLTERLKEGKGDNQLNGTLLQRVLSEVDERGSHIIFEKLKPTQMPEPMPLPWPKHIPGHNGKGPLPMMFEEIKSQELHQKLKSLDGGLKHLE